MPHGEKASKAARNGEIERRHEKKETMRRKKNVEKELEKARKQAQPMDKVDRGRYRRARQGWMESGGGGKGRGGGGRRLLVVVLQSPFSTALSV